MRDGAVERFWAKVDQSAGPDGCWPWLRATRRGGYGVFHNGVKLVTASRFAWELAHPDDVLSPRDFICHRCDNPSCCNPAHLFLGTCGDNLLDASLKGRMRSTGNRTRGAARRKTPNQINATKRRAHVLRLRKLLGSNQAVAEVLGVSVQRVDVLMTEARAQAGIPRYKRIA